MPGDSDFLRLLLGGADFELELGDTLRDDIFWQLRADRIAIDPPIASAFQAAPRMGVDPRWAWGVPMRSRADLLWVQHAAHHLADDGVAVIVVSPITLSQAGAEADIRAKLVASDLLDAVIDLPPGTLTRTARGGDARRAFASARRSSWERAVRGRATPRCDPATGPDHLGPDEIAKIADTVRAWRSGTWTPEDGFSASSQSSTLLEHGSSLAPSRWVSYSAAPAEIGGEPIVERYERLSGLVRAHLEDSSSLLRDLEDALEDIEVTHG